MEKKLAKVKTGALSIPRRRNKQLKLLSLEDLWKKCKEDKSLLNDLIIASKKDIKHLRDVSNMITRLLYYEMKKQGLNKDQRNREFFQKVADATIAQLSLLKNIFRVLTPVEVKKVLLSRNCYLCTECMITLAQYLCDKKLSPLAVKSLEYKIWKEWAPIETTSGQRDQSELTEDCVWDDCPKL